ncbi:MAG: endolytic transglycosylase MltG [Marinicellaceae bacterium]
MLKKLFLLTILLGTFAVGAFGYYYSQYQLFLNTSVFQKDTVVDIQKGKSFKGFSQYLLANNANGEEWNWRIFARLEKVASKLNAGEFLIEAELTPLQMMEKIAKNQVKTYQFTIVEGTNWRELKYKLLDETDLLHTLNDINDEQLLAILDSERTTPEGLFLPETYQFVRGDSDVDILIRAHQSLKQGLLKYWQERKNNVPYKNAYEMLTLASIVEKETSQAHERDQIAGVFVRRLQKNMRLQTDPTVIYGLGESYDGDIKSKDLKTDTPYNTYTRKGLTPTPIAMASIESIAACAHPKDGTALYFVANNRGGHYFSDTYEEHKNAVKGYLKGEKL